MQSNSNGPQNREPGKETDTQTAGNRMIMIAWIIAIALLTTIFGSWEDKQINPNSAPDTYQTQNGVEVTLQRNRYGHYLVSGTVNHQDAIFMLDTGATLVAIPGEIQQELGLISGQSHYTHTANGTAKAYYTVIDRLTIGDIVIRDVKASIVPNMEGRQILLGMSVLKELEFTQKGKQLTLRQVY